MLRFFHVSEEYGKVHDTCHVGISKFNSSSISILICHISVAFKKNPVRSTGLEHFVLSKDLLELVATEWHQSHESSSLNSFGYRMLADSRTTRLSSTNNLSMSVDHFL